MPKLIDLSHTIEEGMITYKGLPAPVICDFLSRETSSQQYGNQETFQIGKIEMVANTGTYIDVPFHRYEQGKDLAESTLPEFTLLKGLVVSVPFMETKAIDAFHFEGLDLEGKAVLVHTGWDKNWRTDSYFEENPFLTESAANFLMESGVKLVGIDSLNIDDTTTNVRPVHSILLKENILIVEHLTGLEQIPENDFHFSAIPPKIKGVGSFPVRAFASIP